MWAKYFVTLLCVQVLVVLCPSQAYVIGIDLGTTYSCVGVVRKGRVEIIPNDQGNRITPSMVAFTEDGVRLIGDAAKSQLSQNPENTIFDVKRFIGRRWNEVKGEVEHYPFNIVERDGRPAFQVHIKKGKGNSRIFSPEEISSMVLLKMKETAEAYLGEPVTDVVITVPAYFTDAQRQATKDAATIAKLNPLRIINEPTAAAIAYGFGQKTGDLKLDRSATSASADGVTRLLVYDLGGGTFDVSLLEVDQNSIFEVHATSGNTRLGGQDFDLRVVNHLIDVHLDKTGTEVRGDHRAVEKLRREVERAKRTLSSYETAQLEIENFQNRQHYSTTLTRKQFEELNKALFLSTLDPVKAVLKDAGWGKEKVDEILLVGGSTRIPKIRELVSEYFRGVRIQYGVNVDEMVAYGATVQAGVLAGEKDMDDLILLDINPLTLGIETVGGVMSPLVKRNTVIPFTYGKKFSTAEDNQDSVTIQVFEGERSMTKDNHKLGQFDLEGIPPAPRGVPNILVEFFIDANGILQVTAKDEGSGRSETRKIANNYNRLKSHQIRNMIDQAEEYAEKDKLEKENVEARNELEQYVYLLKATIKDGGVLANKLNDDESRKLGKALDDVIGWLDSNPKAETSEYTRILSVIKPKVDRFLDKYMVDLAAERRNSTGGGLPPREEL